MNDAKKFFWAVLLGSATGTVLGWIVTFVLYMLINFMTYMAR